MKPTLKPGISTTRTITVDESRVINFMGDDCRVYATPRTISDLEYTTREFLLAHLDPGEDSVKLAQAEGRRLTFEATITAGADPVAHGTHERFVVDVQKVRERLLKRRAQRS